MLNTLLSPEGPVDQLTRILISLEAKLAKPTGWKEKRRLLIWPFEKSDVQSSLSVIERQKSLVVLALQGDNLEFNKIASRELLEISTEVEAVTELIRNYGQENSYSTDLLRDHHEQKILEWLSETDFFIQKNDMMNKIQKGTGKWLLESRAFQNWRTGQSSRMLWCHGISGAGKTYLASSVIGHLEQSFSGQEVGISYLYCDYKNLKQTVAVLLGSLTRRLLHCRASITTYVETLYKLQIKQGLHPSTDEYVSLLQKISDGMPKVFIIVDALDEYKEIDATRTKFLECLQSVSPVKTRMLITTKRLKEIERDLLDAPELEI